MWVQGELQPRSGTELNQTHSHLDEGEVTWVMIDEDKKRRGRETNKQKQNEPCLVRCLVLDRVWLHSVWISQSFPSLHCKIHPWGRGYPWLLSTASLPMEKHTHIHIHSLTHWISEYRHEFKLLYYLHCILSSCSSAVRKHYGIILVSDKNGLLQMKVIPQHNKRTSLACQSSIFFLPGAQAQKHYQDTTLSPSLSLSPPAEHVCTRWWDK